MTQTLDMSRENMKALTSPMQLFSFDFRDVATLGPVLSMQTSIPIVVRRGVFAFEFEFSPRSWP